MTDIGRVFVEKAAELVIYKTGRQRERAGTKLRKV